MQRFAHGPWLALVVLGCWVGEAQAVPITLFNTGVDPLGVPLPSGTLLTPVPDPHYAVLFGAGPPPVFGPAFVIDELSPPVSPFPGWLPSSLTSKWISPHPSATELDVEFHIQTTFEILGGLDPDTAVITGSWAVDDDASLLGLGIFLNGVFTGNLIPLGTGPGVLTGFSISGADFPGVFVLGLNTLSFEFEGSAPPDFTGLRVEGIAGEVAVVIPEPLTATLVGLGLAMMVAVAALRREKK